MSNSVVVVDDDGMDLDVMVSIIEDHFDATVYSFTDARTALTFITKKSEGDPCLILSDLIMPRLSGMELLATIRREGIKAPVVLVSDEVTRDSALAAKKFGASGFLLKPFDKQSLIEKVKNILN